MNDLEASMGPQLYRCGNTSIGNIECRDMALASMGPQLYRCGNFAGKRKRAENPSCFNGAATLSLRKCEWATLINSGRNRGFNGAATLSLRKCLKIQILNSSADSICFNGAATLSLRKSIVLLDEINTLSPLQWGRNFIVAEISALPPSVIPAASLQWGRNFIVAEIESNEVVRDLLALASMGPQLYRCGNKVNEG